MDVIVSIKKCVITSTWRLELPELILRAATCRYCGHQPKVPLMPVCDVIDLPVEKDFQTYFAGTIYSPLRVTCRVGIPDGRNVRGVRETACRYTLNTTRQGTSKSRFYSVEVSQALVARLTRVRFTVGPILLPFALSITQDMLPLFHHAH